MKAEQGIVHYSDDTLTLYHGDALTVARQFSDCSVQTIVTSPPYYGLRDYGEDGQLGSEDTVGEYVQRLVGLFAELRRVLADDGTLWLNLGDSYVSSPPGNRDGAFSSSGLTNPERQFATNRGHTDKTRLGIPAKNLIGVPWRVAFALQEDGWILRSDIIWHKPNPMPESVTDRPTKAHEYLFLFAKSPRYYYDAEAISEVATGMSSGNGFVRPEQISRSVGSDAHWGGRPQLRRAWELFHKHGLGDEHLAAIRAIGMNDAGKARETQIGAGRNDPEMQRLSDEAKAALGGYYREFLVGGTRNRRDVWMVPTAPFSEAHFAVYPPELIRPCILAGSRPGDTVLDPFSGSGTTGMVALQEGRKYVGIDLNAEYLDLSLRTRFMQPVLNMEI